MSAQKSPDAFLPHKIGDQFTPHHMLTDYFEYLAGEASNTMRLEPYGRTNEARPLQIAIFSSPENMSRLEEIRINQLRMAGREQGKPDTDSPVAIVWLSMSVHGNEPSGSECSMQLAWELATQTDAGIKSWLQNTVVIIDPSLNPDGYSRYTHWYRMAANTLMNPDPNSREHHEPWPGGRTNHYHFDLNRDWAWASQVETQQRLKVYHRWLPHIHADLHEQYINAPYYFAPAAEPMHDFISQWQRSFQTEIGENHARYFDANGWLYFTKEVFDLFYPSYGDTYPLFNGSIGMTYEQAGHGMAGRSILKANGDTLTLHERIEHHLSTSRSTIEMGSKNAQRLSEQFREYFYQSVSQPQGTYKAYLIPMEGNDGNKINQLCNLLDQHHITYGKAGTSGNATNAFAYHTGLKETASYSSEDLVISAYQPHSVLLQALFEPESRLSDSLTYDVTAWALPFSYGLKAFGLQRRLEPKGPFDKWEAPQIRLAASPYAWCIHRKSINDIRFICQLMQQNVRVRYASQAFSMSDQQFAPGTFVINRADNKDLEGSLDGLVLAAADANNISLHPIFSGMVRSGKDLGSDAFVPIRPLKAAVVYGDEVNPNSYGHTWHCFETELQQPISTLQLDRLQRTGLNDYSVLIFPDGKYNLSEGQLEALQQFVSQGGRIIAFDGGAKALADQEGFDLKQKESTGDSTAQDEPPLYQQLQRDKISETLPGAVIETRVDPGHPLAFGISNPYYSLKTAVDAYEMPSGNTTAAVWVPKSFTYYGFIGSRVISRIERTPVALMQKMGSGEVVYFADNPLFRSMWQEGKLLFANALLF